MSVVGASGFPEELTAELRVKFSRYSTADATQARQINLSGFKFLLKSCPNTALSSVPEEGVEEIFLSVAGPGSTKRSRWVPSCGALVRALPLQLLLPPPPPHSHPSLHLPQK
jgi:hypothetical protein